jgi:hypothetical protein
MGRVDHLLSALQAELIACLHGVQGGMQLGDWEFDPGNGRTDGE